MSIRVDLNRNIKTGYYLVRGDLTEAAKKYPGVQAIMYTTWENNFSDMKAFAETIRGAFRE